MGKTYALEACLWNLCGMSDDSKADPDMDTRTIKASAGMTTNPIAIDDGESTKKETKLVTAAFYRTKYKTKQGAAKNIAVYMITSNVMNRYPYLIVITQPQLQLNLTRVEVRHSTHCQPNTPP